MLVVKDVAFRDCNSVMLSEWENLVRTSKANPSSLPGWIACTVNAFNLEEVIRVAYIHREGVLVAVLPYFFSYEKYIGLKVKNLELAGNLFSYHQGLICIDECADVLDTFLNFHSRENHWDAFKINAVVKDSDTSKAFKYCATKNNYSMQHIEGELSPYLPLTSAWQDLLVQKLKKKFRYKVKKREQSLKENASYSIKWFSEPEQMPDLIDLIFTIEQRSWKKDAEMDIFNNPIEKRLYEKLPIFLAENSLLIANALYFENKPIAYNLCYKWNAQVGQVKTSFDDEFKDHSPGAILIEETIRTLIADKFVEFDFLGDAMPHKLMWTKEARAHVNHIVYSHTINAKVILGLRKAKSFFYNILRYIIKNKP